MKSEQIKETLLSNMDRFGYGETIHEDEFCSMFQIEKLDNVSFIQQARALSKDEIKDLLNSETLTELSISEVVKTELRKLGRHMVKSGKAYRVCLPSENEAIAARYKRKAARANNKAKCLLRNTPKESSHSFSAMNCLV
ncbi:coil containing protein [Vibrio phage 1.266.O._10N.286.52.F9]|nr:coil containing protein [Vibrio phage 1.266.O._10N.286.52.F9]